MDYFQMCIVSLLKIYSSVAWIGLQNITIFTICNRTVDGKSKVVRLGKWAAQLIPRVGIQIYTLGVGRLPTQGPTALYTHSPSCP
jgi:hypothetical protein